MINENYITIQGWMINNLKLKGNELMLYAIIYGFSQDGKTEYYGSQRYISNALKISLPTVNSLIKKLLSKKLIINTSESHYIATVKETLTPQKEPLKKLKQSVKETLTIGVKETLTNNNNTNNKNNNKNNIDFLLLLDFLINKTGRKFKLINKTVRKSFNARIREGYTKEIIMNSIINASNNQYHKDNGSQYLTPEFFSRASTLDKYGSEAVVVEKTEVSQKMNEGTFVNF